VLGGISIRAGILCNRERRANIIQIKPAGIKSPGVMNRESKSVQNKTDGTGQKQAYLNYQLAAIRELTYETQPEGSRPVRELVHHPKLDSTNLHGCGERPSGPYQHAVRELRE